MFRLASQLAVAGATALIAAAPAGAQEPVLGGTLFSTQSSAFSWTLLQAPTTVDWRVNLRYSTGPGPTATGVAGGFSYSSNGLFSCSGSTCSPYSLGTPLFPSVPGNTNLIVSGNTLAVPAPNAQILHTGMSEFKFLTQPDQGDGITVHPLGAVFYGANNTAGVGFALSAAGPFPESLNSYPIQLSFSGVSRTALGLGDGGVGQVPEPEMWMLTLVGVLGAGLLRRRKRPQPR